MKTHIPNKLRDYRKQTGLLQRDVIAILGHTSTNRLSRWEKGIALPHLYNLIKLYQIYKVDSEKNNLNARSSFIEKSPDDITIFYKEIVKNLNRLEDCFKPYYQPGGLKKDRCTMYGDWTI